MSLKLVEDGQSQGPIGPLADVIYMMTIKADWHEEIRQWIFYLKAAGRAESTRRTRLEHVTWLARDMAGVRGPFGVTLDDLMGWAASHDWAMETRRGVRTSVRSFYAWAEDTGRIPMSPATKWPTVKAVMPLPRPASEDDYQKALKKANQPRKRAMLRLAAEVGLRRAEVAVVHRRDFYQDHAGWNLWVHGKGGKLIPIPLVDDIAEEVLALIKTEGGGYAFPGNYGDGHLSPRWVGKIVTKLLPGTTTMHQLRHKFGTDVHHETGDLIITQGLLRHATVATTQRYVLPNSAAQRAAVESLRATRRAAA